MLDFIGRGRIRGILLKNMWVKNEKFAGNYR